MEETIQEMQTPLKPSKDERKWIRSPYNWGGGVLLIHFGLANLIGLIVILIAAISTALQPCVNKETFAEFSKSFSEFGFLMVLTNLIASVIAYPIVILIGCKGLKVKARSFFSTKGYDAKFVILAVIVALGAQLVGSYSSVFVTWIFDQIGVTFTTLDTSVKTDMATNIMMYALACISAPIFEEMIFRGLILRAFSKVSIRFGIIASSAMFGLFHQNIPQAINAFIVGLVFGYVAYKAGSIIPCMIMHFALNANAMVQEAIVYYFKDYSQQIDIVWTVLIAVGALAVLVLNRHKFSLPKDTKATKKRTLPLFATSVSIIAVVVFIAATAMSIKIQ